MSKLKLILFGVAFFIASFSVSSCGAFSNMSYEEAYDFGYGIGRMIGSIDN